MTAGKRDTWITVENRTTEQDADYGTQESTWAEFGGMWAEVQDVLPSRSELVDASISITRRPTRIRIDYLDGMGITADMRIDIDGRKLEIVGGPAMKGVRKEWEIVAEEVSTRGDPV